MNKSAIEWTDFTWNPVTGCLTNCHYCYARQIATRSRRPLEVKEITPGFYEAPPGAIFPRGFNPTFYPHRLVEPLKLGWQNKSTIFVGSMADVFGPKVPAEWIERILKVVRRRPQNTFIFLTKNPERYRKFDFPDNCLLGATATDQASWDRAADVFVSDGGIRFLFKGYRVIHNLFISAEPLLGPIETGCEMSFLSWLIIGANSNRGAARPKPVWGMDLMEAAFCAGVPIFVKNNWPWPGPWPQELPEVSDGE